MVDNSKSWDNLKTLFGSSSTTSQRMTAHSRKRSATLSSLITPPTPLRDGQSKTLKLWISDDNPDRIVLNHESWPGVAIGDVIQVQSAASAAKKDDMSVFCFVVGKDGGGKYGNLQQITVPKHLATVFGLQNRSEVILTKINKESVTADAVELYFRDQYLGRCDMWRLEEHLEEQCIHIEEKVTFAGCITATVKALYVKNKKVSSAYVTPKTKMIFRSMSSKTTILIQVCRELWDFADDGERYYEKICHFFLPALIERWRSLGTTHVVTVVLISRVFYEGEEEKKYAAGPLRTDPDTGRFYKDFYKVVVDLEVVHDWKPSLVYLKESFWAFQRDILLAHHYHQHVRAHEQQRKDRGIGDTDFTPINDIPVQLVGRISMAHEGPILEALNLSMNPFEAHYVDRSLVLTGSSTILVTPGTGHFSVNKRLLQLTTMRLLDQGFGLDMISLSKAPLHRSPVFSFWGVEPGLNESIPGLRDTDPLWVWEEEDKPLANKIRRNSPPQVKKLLYWEPFWVSLSFWDQQNNMPFREDRFVPRARMYEIQMLGLLAHDVSTLAIPPLEENEGVNYATNSQDPRSREETMKAIRDDFDADVFALKGQEKATTLSRVASTNASKEMDIAAIPRTGSPAERVKADYRSHLSSYTISEEKSTLSTVSSTSSIATTVATFKKDHRTQDVTPQIPTTDGPRSPISEKSPEETTRASSPAPLSQRSQSPSQLSLKSTSTRESKESKRKTSRAGALGSKFGVGQWLFGTFTSRSTPSQAEASQVSIIRGDVGKPTLAISNQSPPEKPTSSPPQEISPVKRTAQPIAIRHSGSTSRRANRSERAEEKSKVPTGGLDRAQAYATPFSASPGQESTYLAMPLARRTTSALEPVAIPPTNPSRPVSLLSHSQSSLARKWQHIFPTPTLHHQIKWRSMCTPACLPLTTEYYPSKTEMEKAYQVYSYDVLVTPDAHASFMLKRTAETDEEEEWPLLVMRQMAALRLALGFQFIVAPNTSAMGNLGRPSSTGLETATSTRFSLSGASGRYSAPVHPVGASEVLKSITDYVYLSMSNQIHRISFDPVEQVIRVSRYVRRTTHSLESWPYEALVWPRLGDGYRRVTATFSHPNLDMYGWNRMDMLVAGYEHDLAESLRYWRTRFVVIPADTPPSLNQIAGEKLSDEEIRVLGADKLADLFHKARWYKPFEKPEDTAPTRFLMTTLEPSACVLDEHLMAQLDRIHEQGPLKKKANVSKTVEDTPLATLAKSMREEDGVPMKDHIWHRNVYPDSFSGYDFVSWLVKEYKDVATREQGIAWGVRLMEQGLFEHCRGAHGFMDGHYYYRLKDEYSSSKPRGPGWFRSSNAKAPSPDVPTTPTATFEAVATRAGFTPNTTPLKMTALSKKDKRRLVLSQTMIINVDVNNRSKYAETAILHHDVIHNPGTALHFELNWMGTTARFIDDLVQTWSRTIERYGLRLVEAYVDPIVTIQEKNFFQSTFPIRLAVPPPVVPNLAARLPAGANPEHFFENAILKHLGYILDIEAEGRYSDIIDVCYSYRRSSFEYSQWIHKSGLAFVAVIGGTEGFRWLTNRLAGTSNNFNAYGWPGTAGGAAASRPGSMAPGTERAERVATSVLIQRQLKGLSEFCADPGRLQAFYNNLIATLPPEPEQSAL